MDSGLVHAFMKNLMRMHHHPASSGIQKGRCTSVLIQIAGKTMLSRILDDAAAVVVVAVATSATVKSVCTRTATTFSTIHGQRRRLEAEVQRGSRSENATAHVKDASLAPESDDSAMDHANALPRAAAPRAAARPRNRLLLRCNKRSFWP